MHFCNMRELHTHEEHLNTNLVDRLVEVRNETGTQGRLLFF